MDKLFSSGDRAQDVLDWSAKLQAMGRAVSTLSFAQRQHDDKTFELHGEDLGEIIYDYAKAINSTAEMAYSALTDFFELNLDHILLHELSQELKRIKVSRNGHDTRQKISDALKKIDSQSDYIDGLKRLKIEFLSLQKNLKSAVENKLSVEEKHSGEQENQCNAA